MRNYEILLEQPSSFAHSTAASYVIVSIALSITLTRSMLNVHPPSNSPRTSSSDAVREEVEAYV